MDAAHIEELARAMREQPATTGGSIIIVPVAERALGAATSLAQAIGAAELVRVGGPGELEVVLALADQVVVTNDQPELLTRACAAGKPVAIFDLPRWHDRVPALRPLVKLGALLTGGGTTYRGTPHQQHGIGRFFDRLAERGLFYLAQDTTALQRALIGRGLATRLGAAERVARPRPLDETRRVAARVRELLREAPAPA
jgi:hypothetical protein